MTIDVLIVEDEPSILDSLDFILRRAGWSTQAAQDGEEALRAVREIKPRVVVLDVMLPKKSGFEVLKLLRQDEQTLHLPVLMLTAKGQAQDRRIAEELGANSFVTKPYANSDVVGAVKALIGDEQGLD
ncbi:response regulator transcription factor [Maritalea myrionectae]|uniref:Transcriptional regulatory protein SrrA n=1 Tax=Maritalea myrionectae TaxID=454601 RepID=A0A2R4MCU2_9HYPH|nr:response regulator [Maritalea myrionectae]AVX03745.1 transcriptional regulatory protein SrrA [Maritalea myrionectae]